MIWQVRATIYFDEEDEGRDFYRDCEKAMLKGIAVNPDSQNSEFSIIELIQNHHDESPNSPCDLVSSETNQPT